MKLSSKLLLTSLVLFWFAGVFWLLNSPGISGVAFGLGVVLEVMGFYEWLTND